MSGYGLAEFMAYWEEEGARYQRQGDYVWMASLPRGKRVLEIGCGLGFGTVALLERGIEVLALDSLDECLVAANLRAPLAKYLKADITSLTEQQLSQIRDYAPDAVVCWLMGAPAEITGAAPHDGGKAVAAYREKIHRHIAQLGTELSSVREIHLVDRTAIAWQAKDLGRDTLVGYHNQKTFSGLPFSAHRSNAIYRKLGEGKALSVHLSRLATSAMKQVVPTLASLLAERNA